MNLSIVIFRIILAVVLASYAVDHISQPSNWYVALGIFEVVLSVLVIYSPLKYLIKQL